MASVPVRASATEEALAAGGSAREAAELAAEGTEPPADIHGSSEYRSHLARVLVGRALAEAEGTSRQEVVRRAVLERYERSGHAARVQDSSGRLIEKWGDVLDRLGTV